MSLKEASMTVSMLIFSRRWWGFAHLASGALLTWQLGLCALGNLYMSQL